MNIEYTATRSALTEAGRSNMSLIIPEITPFTVGQLLFMLEIQTVFAAGLYDVDPADQPGVEANKRHIRRMLDGDFPNTELNHSKSPDHAEYIL